MPDAPSTLGPAVRATEQFHFPFQSKAMIDQTTPLLESQNGHHAVSTLQAVTRWWTSVDHCVHVIDDDCRFLEAVGYVLKNVELRAEQYPSAARYLSTRTTHDADCIVLDLRMPDMSGVDLLKTL